jgi:hypothetical protein
MASGPVATHPSNHQRHLGFRKRRRNLRRLAYRRLLLDLGVVWLLRCILREWLSKWQLHLGPTNRRWHMWRRTSQRLLWELAGRVMLLVLRLLRLQRRPLRRRVSVRMSLQVRLMRRTKLVEHVPRRELLLVGGACAAPAMTFAAMAVSPGRCQGGADNEVSVDPQIFTKPGMTLQCFPPLHVCAPAPDAEHGHDHLDPACGGDHRGDMAPIQRWSECQLHHHHQDYHHHHPRLYHLSRGLFQYHLVVSRVLHIDKYLPVE